MVLPFFIDCETKQYAAAYYFSFFNGDAKDPKKPATAAIAYNPIHAFCRQHHHSTNGYQWPIYLCIFQHSIYQFKFSIGSPTTNGQSIIPSEKLPRCLCNKALHPLFFCIASDKLQYNPDAVFHGFNSNVLVRSMRSISSGS